LPVLTTLRPSTLPRCFFAVSSSRGSSATMRSGQLLDTEYCLFDCCFLVAQFVQYFTKIHLSPGGLSPVMMISIVTGRIKYRVAGIGEKVYIRWINLGHRCRFWRAACNLIFTARWATAPFRELDLAQPSRRSSPAAASSDCQTFQAQDSFLDLLLFPAQIRQHSVHIHGASILIAGVPADEPF
jgi:hypothetical protein